jgi:hypothetical protein
MSINVIAFASVTESVSNNTLRYTSTQTFAVDNITNLQVTLSSKSSQKFNYMLDFKFIPKDKGTQADLFLKDIYMPKTPVFSYWETSNPYGYKISEFTKTLNSYKNFYKNGYKIDYVKEELKQSYDVIYVPATAYINFDSYYGDFTKKSNLKTLTNWTTHTDFNVFLLESLKNKKSITFNLIYFYSEVDAFKTQNPNKYELVLSNEMLQEWYEVFNKAGFIN